MNETARFWRQMRESRPLLRCTIKRHAAILRERQDDEPDDGIGNCGQRYIAGLLLADDAFAEPPRKSERATRRLLARRRQLYRGRGAGASPVGSAAIAPHATAQAIRAIQPEAIAEAAPMGEAAMAEAEAINPSHLRNDGQPFDPAQEKFLDSFQFALGSVWNHSKTQFFFLHPATIFNIDRAASPRALPFS